MKNLTKASKFLSYVLRHKPDAIGLNLNEEGWASVDELIDKAQSEIKLDRGLIGQVVATSNKKRFALSDDGLLIRANQGHSVKVDLGLKPTKPPAILYHGTATRFLNSIMQEGLKPGKRHHVHLSSDIDTAKAVGQRYGKPVILQINAEQMHNDGYQFFLSDNHVWLTKPIPFKFLSETNA